MKKMEVEIQNFSSEFDRCFSKYAEDDNARSRSIHLTRILTKLKKEFVPRFASNLKSWGGNMDGDGLKGQNWNFLLEAFSMITGEGDNEAKITIDSVGDTSSSVKAFSLVGTLLSIINDNHDNNDKDNNRGGDSSFWFPTTEGHREMGCEILKSLFCSLFSVSRNGGKESHSSTPLPLNDLEASSQRRLRRSQLVFHRRIISLFHHFSVVFQNRMSRHTNSTKSSHGGSSGGYGGGLRLSSQTKGSMTEPIETSEYIRSLLMELAVDLANNLIDSGISLEGTLSYDNLDLSEGLSSSDSSSDCNNEVEQHVIQQPNCLFKETQQLLLRATCNLCNTLAKSSLLDPYPEVQRTCCLLIEKLARLCPLGVRMNSLGLLSPLTGLAKENIMTVSGTMPAVSKDCLFRHRHAKTRSRAVDASVAIVMCCPREAPNSSDFGGGSCGDENELLPDIQHIQLENARVATVSSATVGDRGSRSSTLENVLNDVLLLGWQDLLISDTSAAVKISVVAALEKVSHVLCWRSVNYSHCWRSVDNGGNLEQQHINSSCPTSGRVRTLDVPFHVEAKALSLLILGLSNGNVDQVQTAASRVLCSLSNTDITDNTELKRDDDLHSRLPSNILRVYFQSILELLLGDCSHNWAVCQSRVRSFEALHAFLSLVSPLLIQDGEALESSCMKSSDPNEKLSIDESTDVLLSKMAMLRVIYVLIGGMLSDDKNVVEAALSCCQCLGNCDTYSKLVLECLTSTAISTTKDVPATVEVICTEKEAEEPMESQSFFALSSPRQMIGILLLLDSLMKGCVSNDSNPSVLKRVDPVIFIHKPTWFKSKTSAEAISSMLCHPTVTSNVMSHSSLAWALLDACSSFTKCAETLQCNLGEEFTIRILLSLVYLLGCPEEFGLVVHSSVVLRDLSSLHNVKQNSSSSAGLSQNSLLDLYFRQLLPKIALSGPSFPWKCSEPSFRAMDAFLRCANPSTIGGNFDVVAPFFIHHLSNSGFKKSEDCDGNDSSNSLQEKTAEEYSMRISLMSLLQAILSDGSFDETIESELPIQSILSKNFATDVLLSLVLPNLVWRSGGLAAALRKLSAATMFSLLSHHNNRPRRDADVESDLYKLETLLHLIPILHSNLEDTESTTRELCCHCLSLILEQLSIHDFQSIWEADTRVVDTLYPRLLMLLDDSHDPVRMATCTALQHFLRLAYNPCEEGPTCRLGVSSLEEITSSLIIQLDDPDAEIRCHVAEVFTTLLDIQRSDSNNCDNIAQSTEMKSKVIEMMDDKFRTAFKSHRYTQHINSLLENILDLKKEISQRNDKII
eukprot:CAMPEP_0171364746 /NCGR_PEP_ID=MMETSP0879-20121228/4217_1 /TAXON_ID=67004 /ORGANISM="Thalassiosira weissflogii, Strain CCMP1336" /LENGTH=1303 /DNA_ID=CAMNT_0011872163 /DNA_START=115 /DNA_END=4026 /DNA_ORIENTATION=+